MEQSILICDDAMFARTMLGQILTKAGYQVVGEAGSGEEAVEKYRMLKPDLVTMDMIMPGMTGVDAVREIVKEFPEACIIMCTAMGQEQLVREAIKAGAKGFIVKPINGERVLTVVREMLT